MRTVKFLGKLIYFVNWLAVLLLLACFVASLMPPASFPYFNLLSLAVSPLILINVLFAIYWIFRGKRRFVPSVLILILAFLFFKPVVWNTAQRVQDKQKSLSVLSYNVRLFNAYEKEPEPQQVRARFAQLIASHNPDVLCIQEYYEPNSVDFSSYPYRMIHYKDSTNVLGHAIFSKYPLVNQGGFDFEGTYNNTIYADVVVGRDTLRVYNFHLQSIGILPSLDFLQARGAERLSEGISAAFVKQQQQAEQIVRHREQSPYPVLMAGDLNNSAFGSIYNLMADGLDDAFLQAGNGVGGTYIFGFYPLRIDFILSDSQLTVTDYATLERGLSDHKPIITTLQWD